MEIPNLWACSAQHPVDIRLQSTAAVGLGCLDERLVIYGASVDSASGLRMREEREQSEHY